MDRPDTPQPPGRPSTSSTNPAPDLTRPPSAPRHGPRRRKNHRGGAKKKARKKSFALPPDEIGQDSVNSEGLEGRRGSFYSRPAGNLSNTSMDSEALLDHRDQKPFIRPRRPSVMTASASFPSQPSGVRPSRTGREGSVGEEDGENAPLLPSPVFQRSETVPGYGSNDARKIQSPSRRTSSRASSNRKGLSGSYNVNYPPSVPGSPALHPSDRMNMSFGDALLRDELEDDHRSARRGSDESGSRAGLRSSPLDRRKTIPLEAEEDVCFPQDGLSDIADDELPPRDSVASRLRRRRRTKWPDLSILEEWSQFEKEGRSEERRAKKITEPQLINGRLRPVNRGWFQAEEQAPYRFTYFNEEFPSTIHSQTISELVRPGGTFKELFLPDPPLLSDTEGEEEEDDRNIDLHQVLEGQIGDPRIPARQPSLATTTQNSAERKHSGNSDKPSSDGKTDSEAHGPALPASPELPPKPPRYGDRPIWWLDILSPTEAEMKVISKAFGIHPLTAEDIMMQEQREKVELFRNYYFVSYRTFDQDQTSENFLEPVNMYVVVFREGVLSFHFSVTPHPANVRRRIRQLRDYLMLSSDWISYAIIDDITDAFGPLIHSIEDEVDEIDFAILQMHSGEDQAAKEKKKELSEKSEAGDVSSADAGRDMLRRVGDCRKKVMSLYRLLSNKADVIKGFAKRCNERWEVAPRSEIGLYLGDIQDHIVTMTSNLSHYEKILARSHGNYLAQINLRMNERQEQTADVLGKLTVLGTIVLPMNIITGLWGMNVWVPGQEYEGDLKWFIAITAGLICFGLSCYWIAKRVYKIV